MREMHAVRLHTVRSLNLFCQIKYKAQKGGQITVICPSFRLDHEFVMTGRGILDLNKDYERAAMSARPAGGRGGARDSLEHNIGTLSGDFPVTT